MPVIHTLGADVLKSNVEARQAHHDLSANVNKLGIRKGADTGKAKKSRAKKADKVDEVKTSETESSESVDSAESKE